MAFDFGVLSGTAVSAAERLVNGVGRGIGSLMNRVGWTEKMSEKEKYEKLFQLMDLDNKGADSARQMYMTEMQTQKHSWLVAQLNGIYRPFCGFCAIIYLTERIWGQIINRYWGTWQYLDRDPVVDLCMTSIIGFFFYLRQRSKEQSVTNIT